jgi:predicted outer membrane repeat protein
LRLEALEDRCVPSTFAVTSADDNAAEHGTLRWAVANAVSGDTILITAALKDTPIVLTQGELLLNQDVSIRGVGNVAEKISGDGLSRVFNIAAGATVSLANLTITGGAGDPGDSTGGDGGAILNNGSLSLDGCTFSGSGADARSVGGYVFAGGAVANNGMLAATDSTFTGNSAFWGGGIFSTGQLTLDNCAVTGNTAIAFFLSFGGSRFYLAGTGGALFNDGGTATLDGCTVSGNSASMTPGSFSFDQTGGIDNTGTLQMTGCTVAGNSGYTGGIGGSGTVIIDSSSFSGNGADSAGTLSATASTFSGDYVGGQGGMVSNCTFASGGLANAFSAMTIGNCSFTDAQVTNGKNAVIGETMTVSGCTFTASRIDNFGTVALDDCTVTASSQAVNNKGFMTLDGCTLTGNRNAIINHELGYSNFATSMRISNCTISDNVGDQGAAILNDDNTVQFGLAATVIIDHCTVSGNSASGDGGAIYNNNGLLIINDSILSGNTAGRDGGAIYNFVAPIFHPFFSDNSIVIMTNSILSGNSAGLDGGGIFNAVDATSGYPGMLTVTGSAFSNNSAGNEGGGIYNEGTATVSSCTFAANSASSGGGIYNFAGAMLTVSGSTFSANTPDAIFGLWIDGGGNTFC